MNSFGGLIRLPTLTAGKGYSPPSTLLRSPCSTPISKLSSLASDPVIQSFYKNVCYSQFQFTFHREIPKFVRNFRSTFLIWEVGRELCNELRNEVRNEFVKFTANSRRSSLRSSKVKLTVHNAKSFKILNEPVF